MPAGACADGCVLTAPDDPTRILVLGAALSIDRALKERPRTRTGIPDGSGAAAVEAAGLRVSLV
ncbi:MAG: hypothetical protein K8T90_10060 [Planctomycetes bacterium]|nr:hypothetical protein [Planctomycetota bacterium]